MEKKKNLRSLHRFILCTNLASKDLYQIHPLGVAQKTKTRTTGSMFVLPISDDMGKTQGNFFKH